MMILIIYAIFHLICGAWCSFLTRKYGGIRQCEIDFGALFFGPFALFPYVGLLKKHYGDHSIFTFTRRDPNELLREYVERNGKYL